jgi:hypothetical protein
LGKVTLSEEATREGQPTTSSGNFMSPCHRRSSLISTIGATVEGDPGLTETPSPPQRHHCRRHTNLTGLQHNHCRKKRRDSLSSWSSTARRGCASSKLLSTMDGEERGSGVRHSSDKGRWQTCRRWVAAAETSPARGAGTTRN